MNESEKLKKIKKIINICLMCVWVFLFAFAVGIGVRSCLSNSNDDVNGNIVNSDNSKCLDSQSFNKNKFDYNSYVTNLDYNSFDGEWSTFSHWQSDT